MKRKDKAPPRSAKAVPLLICAAVFLTWATSMFCATLVAKGFAQERYDSANEVNASLIADRCFDSTPGAGLSGMANYEDSRFWEAAAYGARIGGLSPGSFYGKAESLPVYSAAAIYDADGQLIECSWRDFIYFQYLTPEQLISGDAGEGYARAFIDASLLTAEGAEAIRAGAVVFVLALRFTGAFDGKEFTPSLIEFFDYDDYETQTAVADYDPAELLSAEDAEWSVLYSDPDALPEGAEPVTLYARRAEVCIYEPSPAFSFDGEDYSGLADFVSKAGPSFKDGCEPILDYLASDELCVSVCHSYNFDGGTGYSSNIYSENISSGEVEVERYIVCASYFSPWGSALRELWRLYLVTFLLAAALALFVNRRIRRRLITPARYVGDALMYGGAPDWWEGADWRWFEAVHLREGWWKRSDEIKRLGTALDYAKTAEQDRRQMVSNIAHELKTPLAVIHSYAEGLKERIAEDKRDKYLGVILSEAERADAMVLEMLDLSRLEAGKVKIERTEFSLPELARSVFARFEMAAQAKGLEIEFDFPEELRVAADEGRLAQVVENFAANAVKYTPEGGCIMVSAERRGSRTRFAVESDCPPLPDEALGKVWESFYRADESRTGGGTGLGLAIAKSIVELHGGSCGVKNTKTGVEFSFEI